MEAVINTFARHCITKTSHVELSHWTWAIKTKDYVGRGETERCIFKINYKSQKRICGCCQTETWAINTAPAWCYIILNSHSIHIPWYSGSGSRLGTWNPLYCTKDPLCWETKHCQRIMARSLPLIYNYFRMFIEALPQWQGLRATYARQ